MSIQPYLKEFSKEDKKRFFLERLRNSRGGYKRYYGSPLRYAGGKSWAVGYIVEHIPSSIERLISPFFGGGSVEIAVASEMGIEVWGWDIFDILVNYWKFQIHYPIQLYEELRLLEPDQNTYKKIKEELRKHWKGEITLPPLKLAAYYYFNHNLSYGPGFLGWMSRVYANPKTYFNLLERVKTFNSENLQVNCSSFEQVLPEYQYDFLYCDPPYYLGPDSTLFRGLYPQRNFPIHHNNFDHKLLRDMLYEHKGCFILSYNDSPTIRKWYKYYKILDLPIQYTMGQGELRIGINRSKDNRNHIKLASELLIIKRS